MSTGESNPPRGNYAGLIAIADGERLQQDRLHVRRERGVRMISSNQATPAQQMGETGLMGGGRELPIWCPAVAHEHSSKVCAEHSSGFIEAATGLNAIDRRVRCREDP